MLACILQLFRQNSEKAKRNFPRQIFRNVMRVKVNLDFVPN